MKFIATVFSVLFFATLCSAAPLQVVERKVVVGQIEVEDALIQYVAFIVDFDGPVFFKNSMNASNIVSAAALVSIKGGQMPPTILAGYGTSEVFCPNSQFKNKSSIFNLGNNGGPPPALLIAPSTSEPVPSFILRFARGLALPETTRPNRFAAVVLLSPDMGFGQRDMNPQAFDNCTLSFNAAVSNNTDLGKLNVISSDNGIVFSSKVDMGNAKRTPACKYEGLQDMTQVLSVITSAATKTSDAKDAIDLAIAAFQIRESYDGCNSLLQSLFVKGNKTVQFRPTKDCRYQYQTMEWYRDPCCNWNLERVQCCVPKSVTGTVPSVQSISAEISRCASEPAIRSLLSSYITWVNEVSTLEKVDSRSLRESLIKFKDQCYSSIYGSCSEDSDCPYSSCAPWGNCVVKPEEEHIVFMKCYLERMPAVVKNAFQAKLGLPVKYSNDAEEMSVLTAKFLQEFIVRDCVGPRSWNFRKQYGGSRINDNSGEVEEITTLSNFAGCLAEKQCNWNTFDWNGTVTQDRCYADAARPNVCAERNGNWDRTVTQWSVCEAEVWRYNSNSRKTICESVNGSYVKENGGWNRCVLSTISQTEDSCFNQTLIGCSPSDKGRCQPACYKAMNASECNTARNTLSSVFSNAWFEYMPSTGVCAARNLNGVDECRNQTGWNFHIGRWFNPGRYETPESCTGTCSIPQLRDNPKVTTEQCVAAKFCTKNCQNKCRSRRERFGGACVDSNSTTSQDCFNRVGGQWSFQDSVCRIQSLKNATQCASISPTYRFLTCEIHNGNKTSCVANPYRDTLDCDYYPADSVCDSEEDCTSSGECNDWVFNNYRQYVPGGGDNGVCAVRIVFDSNGEPTNCPRNNGNNQMQNYMQNSDLCIFYNMTTTQSCTNFGGNWKTRAKTSAQCAAHGQGCSETKFWDLTSKNASDCAACNGVYRNKFKWSAGKWLSGKVDTLQWLAKNYSSINSIGDTLDRYKLDRSLEQTVSGIIGREVLKDVNARYGYLIQILNRTACDCTPGSVERNCFGGKNEIIKKMIAAAPVVPGEPQTIGPITINANTFAGNFSIDFSVDSVPSFQFIEQVVTGPTRLVKRTVTSYPVVKKMNQVCGQALGDGLAISSAATPVNPFSFCMVFDPAITPNTVLYPTYDVGFVVNNSIEPLGAAPVYKLESGSEYLCANATSLGTYYPIRRTTIPTSAVTTTNGPAPAPAPVPAPAPAPSSAVSLTWGLGSLVALFVSLLI